MPVNTRRAALRIIGEVEEGGYFNLILKRELKGMEEQEKRFTSALCFTTLENLRRIDYVIDAFTEGKRVPCLCAQCAAPGRLPAAVF